MGKWWWILIASLSFDNVAGQTVDSSALQREPIPVGRTAKPEIFTNGFVDIMNYGQMNASARFFKLYLGVPGKWVVPVSLYTGVTSTGFAAVSRNNDPLFLGLINPSSGVLNLSIEGSHDFFCWNKAVTKLGLLYQAGERLLSYNDLQTFQVFSFANSFCNAGFLFQTGAWEKNKTDNMGVFWFSSRFLVMASNSYIQSFLAAAKVEKLLYGFSIGLGIDINKVVNIKSYYYRYVGVAGKAFPIPVYHFSFNYSMRY